MSLGSRCWLASSPLGTRNGQTGGARRETFDSSAQHVLLRSPDCSRGLLYNSHFARTRRVADRNRFKCLRLLRKPARRHCEATSEHVVKPQLYRSRSPNWVTGLARPRIGCLIEQSQPNGYNDCLSNHLRHCGRTCWIGKHCDARIDDVLGGAKLTSSACTFG